MTLEELKSRVWEPIRRELLPKDLDPELSGVNEEGTAHIALRNPRTDRWYVVTLTQTWRVRRS